MIAFEFTPAALQAAEQGGFSPHEMLGGIPLMVSFEETAGVAEQIDRAYKEIGGGWRETKGFVLSEDRQQLRFPGDPPRQLIAEARIREERVLFFNGAWVVVLQPDGSFSAARID